MHSCTCISIHIACVMERLTEFNYPSIDNKMHNKNGGNCKVSSHQKWNPLPVTNDHW